MLGDVARYNWSVKWRLRSEVRPENQREPELMLWTAHPCNRRDQDTSCAFPVTPVSGLEAKWLLPPRGLPRLFVALRPVCSLGLKGTEQHRVNLLVLSYGRPAASRLGPAGGDGSGHQRSLHAWEAGQLGLAAPVWVQACIFLG